jgi:hypothetical protein
MCFEISTGVLYTGDRNRGSQLPVFFYVNSLSPQFQRIY